MDRTGKHAAGPLTWRRALADIGGGDLCSDALLLLAVVAGSLLWPWFEPLVVIVYAVAMLLLLFLWRLQRRPPS